MEGKRAQSRYVLEVGKIEVFVVGDVSVEIGKELCMVKQIQLEEYSSEHLIEVLNLLFQERSLNLVQFLLAEGLKIW
jgi:hypothetical protein